MSKLATMPDAFISWASVHMDYSFLKMQLLKWLFLEIAKASD